MRRLLLAVAATAVVLPVSQAGAARTSAKGDPVKTASLAMAQDVAKHNYAAVWSYIYPPYQKTISRAVWLGCQKHNPLIPSTVSIKRLGIATDNRIPSAIPQIGLTHIRDVAVQIVFTVPPDPTLQIAVANAYWVKYQGKWTAVWLQDVYSALSAGKCNTNTATRGLY